MWCNDSIKWAYVFHPYLCKHNRNHHRTSTRLINLWSAGNEQGMSLFLMCEIVPSSLFFPSLSFLQVFGEAVCSPALLEVMHGIEEKFIPKKGEACWQCSLHQAGREAFEEASHALLFGYLNHAVHQASVSPHLHERDRKQEIILSL